MKVLIQIICTTLLLGSGILGCNETKVGGPHPEELIRWPVSLSADPDGQHIYIVNSNFDQFYLGGSIAVLDLETKTIKPDSTVRVAGFGGVLANRFNKEGKLSDLLLTSRLTDTVLRVDVTNVEGGSPLLSCNTDTTANSCDAEHSVGLTSETGFEVEPYATTYIPSTDGRGVLIVSGLSDGYLYIYEVGVEGTFRAITTLAVGIGVQSILFHEHTGRLLLSHRTFALLTSIPLAMGNDVDGNLSVELGTPHILNLPSISTLFDFGRQMVINPDTNQVALAWRSPSSVLFIEPDSSANSGYRFVEQVAVGDGASGLTFAPFGPNGDQRLFVSCFKEDMVYVIDPVSGSVLKTIAVGAGPYSISSVHDENTGRKLVLSANFEANTLSLIQGDETQGDYLTVIEDLPGTSE